MDKGKVKERPLCGSDNPPRGFVPSLQACGRSLHGGHMWEKREGFRARMSFLEMIPR